MNIKKEVPVTAADAKAPHRTGLFLCFRCNT